MAHHFALLNSCLKPLCIGAPRENMFKIIFSWAGEASLAHTSAANKQGGHMPYPAGHRANVKKNIINSARKLFNRHGFENVSLNQIMAGAGLTHGGFYSYFESKSELYSEVLGCFFTHPEWKNCWEVGGVERSSPAVGSHIVRAC